MSAILAGSARRDVLVIGAGPAGVATSHELARAGVDHLVLERGSEIGHTWANLYDSLVLHTGKRLSALPGMPFPASTPVFPTRRDLLEYLNRYVERFRLPVETDVDVVRLARTDDEWVAHTGTRGAIRARVVVVATGIVSNPHVPDIPDRQLFPGRVIHSVDYHRPDSFVGQRVLVVGVGNSAGEIAAELARAGARVAIAVRSGARVLPRELLGIPIQNFAVVLSRLPPATQRLIGSMVGRLSELVHGPAVLPRPPTNGRGRGVECPDVPLIGFHLVDALRAGTIQLKRGLAAFTASGVRFADGSEEDFDQVILATGYQAAIGMLQGLVRLDACGFAARRERVVSLDQPGLYFVGHNYDTQGGLRNIARDATVAARLIGT